MGVLDEAIRQHLELKRKRGADPSEVKREEDEALGAPVRPQRAAGSEQTAPIQSVDTPAPQQVEGEDQSVHQPTQAFDSAEVAEALGQMPADEIGEAEPEPEPPEPDEGPAPATEEPVAEEEPAELAHDAEADDAEPDELEQTPDFLEDAPEHDKLWFEQKPPKDFDF